MSSDPTPLTPRELLILAGASVLALGVLALGFTVVGFDPPQAVALAVLACLVGAVVAVFREPR